MTTELDQEGIQVIEFSMMNKKKYFPLAVVSGFTIRTILYPVTLIRTRLQVQHKKDLYKGTFDAFSKITRYEGIRGLYKGFWITNLMVVPQLTYITTYESVRHYLAHHTPFTDRKIRSFVGGGCASLVGQTFAVPIDVITQHLQMLGSSEQMSKKGRLPIVIPENASSSKFGTYGAVIRAVYNLEGIRGFYRGYLPSLGLYTTNSAMWWLCYDVYCDILSSISPVWVPRLMLQCVAAPLGGITCSFITNPMDVIRTRVQVEHTPLLKTTNQLWKEEGINVLFKGLTARMIQSISFSFFIVLGYETIKRLSVREEYKDQVRW